MIKGVDISRFYFWILLGLTLILTGLGLGAMIWSYGYGWGQTIWHVCQSGFKNLSQHLPLAWQLFTMAVIATVMIRGGWSLGQQLSKTRRFTGLFWPLREKPPARLRKLLKVQNLSAEKIVYLNLAAPRAFCQGFWRPRIWLTSGLVNLLSDAEMTAVLAHEAYHCRQRDPLRILISRTLRSAFFFLPVVSDLAQSAERQQEVAADQAAIRQLGDDLPLLCALQKLLTQRSQGTLGAKSALTSFNATEDRLRRLLYPAQIASVPYQGRELLVRWSLNLGVVIFLGTAGFLSTRPLMEHQEIGACVIDEVANPWQTQLPLSGW